METQKKSLPKQPNLRANKFVLTLIGMMSEGTFHPMSFLDQVLSADF